MTARLWWAWVAVEVGREAIWVLDAASAADGTMLRVYDALTTGRA